MSLVNFETVIYVLVLFLLFFINFTLESELTMEKKTDNDLINISERNNKTLTADLRVDERKFKEKHHSETAEEAKVGCPEVRSKRFISDGFCTSVKAISEVVCTGHCLPLRDLPWYAEFIKVWAKKKVLEWRCVEDVIRRRKVELYCENGEIRTYRIKVIKSCKCVRFIRHQNLSISTTVRRRRGRHRKKRKNRKKNRKINLSENLAQ